MKISFIIIILVVVFSTSILGQSQDTIFWSPSYKLKWEDFQGKAENDSKYKAVTNSGIKYQLSLNKDSVSTKVTCYFLKPGSWAKINNDKTLLSHEQGHFDITELFARRLRKSFAEYKFNYASAKNSIKYLFNLNDQERTKMDILYDKETNLSQDRTNQFIWDKKIKAKLDILKKYASL